MGLDIEYRLLVFPVFISLHLFSDQNEESKICLIFQTEFSVGIY